MSFSRFDRFLLRLAVVLVVATLVALLTLLSDVSGLGVEEPLPDTDRPVIRWTKTDHERVYYFQVGWGPLEAPRSQWQYRSFWPSQVEVVPGEYAWQIDPAPEGVQLIGTMVRHTWWEGPYYPREDPANEPAYHSLGVSAWPEVSQVRRSDRFRGARLPCEDAIFVDSNRVIGGDDYGAMQGCLSDGLCDAYDAANVDFWFGLTCPQPGPWAP